MQEPGCFIYVFLNVSVKFDKKRVLIQDGSGYSRPMPRSEVKRHFKLTSNAREPGMFSVSLNISAKFWQKMSAYSGWIGLPGYSRPMPNSEVKPL